MRPDGIPPKEIQLYAVAFPGSHHMRHRRYRLHDPVSGNAGNQMPDMQGAGMMYEENELERINTGLLCKIIQLEKQCAHWKHKYKMEKRKNESFSDALPKQET